MDDDKADLRSNLGHASNEDQGAQRRQRDGQIDQSLSRTIRAFAARWLPLVVSSRADCSGITTNEAEETVRDSWRAARKDMLKVTNRPSYRSALTLYLFAQTPVPVGISEDEELDGISGLVCMQTALWQIQRLRERQKPYKFDTSSDVSAREGASASCAPTSTPDARLLQTMENENRAYWAAVTWDTSSSLSLNLRTSLTSGLRGACSEPAWRVARTFLTGSFHAKTEHWRTSGFEVTGEMAYQIITAAGVCKLYVWKNVTSLKEALREGVDEATVLFVWKALREAIDIFEVSFRPLLNECGRRLHFLDQLGRLGWYEVNLQYNLGLLLLADALEVADRSDLSSQLSEMMLNAEHEIFNVLKFGVGNTYTMPGPGLETAVDGMSTLPTAGGLLDESITASFVAIDPYPRRIVDSVVLMNKAINRRYRRDEIKHAVYFHLSSILLEALEQLPSSSKCVHATREDVQRSRRNVNSMIGADTLAGDPDQ